MHTFYTHRHYHLLCSRKVAPLRQIFLGLQPSATMMGPSGPNRRVPAKNYEHFPFMFFLIFFRTFVWKFLFFWSNYWSLSIFSTTRSCTQHIFILFIIYRYPSQVFHFKHEFNLCNSYKVSFTYKFEDFAKESKGASWHLCYVLTKQSANVDFN